MGFFGKKKKKEKDRAQQAAAGGQGEAEPAEVRMLSRAHGRDGAASPPKVVKTAAPEGESTSVVEMPPLTARGTSFKKGAGVDPDQGHQVVLRAVSFLAETARDTRGLFEEVRPMSEVKVVWGFFATGDTAAARRARQEGDLNPHAAASLVVYHLRDVADPLCTKTLRAAFLSAAALPKSAERLAEIRRLCGNLPAKNRELLSGIGVMVAAVAAEHDACYKDGIATRMSALGQLFGPLFLRPESANFDTEMAAAVGFAQDIFANPSLLSAPLSISPVSPDTATSSMLSEISPKSADSAAGIGQLLQHGGASGGGARPVPVLKGLPQGSAPLVPALKGLPTGATDRASSSEGLPPAAAKAVTFRAAMAEKGGGDYPDGKPPVSPEQAAAMAANNNAIAGAKAAYKSLPGGAHEGRGRTANQNATSNQPSSAREDRARDSEEAPLLFPAAAAAAGMRARSVDDRGKSDDTDDETNYNVPAAADQWVEEVRGLSDEERKAHLQAAMKGGPMLKYSSRGRATALMFFRLSPDTDMLNWAPVTAPENLKYGLVMDQVVRILPGPLAAGSFQGAASTSKPQLRLVIVLQEDQRLEVEALNSDALDMWAIALQHVVLARLPPDPTMVSPPRIMHGLGGGTHRNWGAPETARGERGPGPVVDRLKLSSPAAVNHGAVTTRLLNNLAGGGEPPQRMPPPAAAAGRTGGSGFATSRAPPRGGGGWGTARHGVPAGPMTARGPGQHGDVAPDVAGINTHLLLSKARHNRKNEMVALLDDASKHLHVDVVDETGNSCLIIACQNNHKKIVKELLRRGCDANLQNHKGHTCLHYCFAYKYSALGEYLISKGADPSIRNRYGFTCFEGLDVQRPATAMANPQAWATPEAPGLPAQVVAGEAPKDPKVEEELRALKQRMDQLEQENQVLKEGAVTARGALTERRGELQEAIDLKATAWAAAAAATPRPPPSNPGVLSPARPASEVRNCHSEEDSESEAASTSELEALDSKSEAMDSKTTRVPEPHLSSTAGVGTGIVGAARKAFELAAAGGLADAKVVRPPPAPPKPAVLDVEAAESVAKKEELATPVDARQPLTTPDDPALQNGEQGSMVRTSLFPLQTPVVEEAASTVQPRDPVDELIAEIAQVEMHGGMYERETRRGDRDKGSCTASSESSAASIDRAGVENIQQRKADKENLQNGESEPGWQGSKVPGAPKGNIKGQKPPPLSGTEGTAAEINTRSPLNLIRKAESARQAAVSGQGTSNERGSSEEDDSAEGRSATSQTPCTPVGGYASVLDSVRNEIMEAERVMAEVTSEFGVDESSNGAKAGNNVKNRRVDPTSEGCCPSTLACAHLLPPAPPARPAWMDDEKTGMVEGACVGAGVKKFFLTPMEELLEVDHASDAGGGGGSVREGAGEDGLSTPMLLESVRAEISLAERAMGAVTTPFAMRSPRGDAQTEKQALLQRKEELLVKQQQLKSKSGVLLVQKDGRKNAEHDTPVSSARELIRRFELHKGGVALFNQPAHQHQQHAGISPGQELAETLTLVPKHVGTTNTTLSSSAVRADISEDEGTDEEERDSAAGKLATAAPAAALEGAPTKSPPKQSFEEILQHRLRVDPDAAAKPAAPRYGAAWGAKHGKGETRKSKGGTIAPTPQGKRSGDWSDSMSDEDNDSAIMQEMLGLGNKDDASDDGGAAGLGERLTLAALEKPGTPSAPAAPAAGSSTLDRVLEAVQDTGPKAAPRQSRESFLAGLGEAEEQTAAEVPPVPARRTASKGKGKAAVYGAQPAVAAAASAPTLEAALAAVGKGAARKPPRVAAGTGSAAKKAAGILTTPSAGAIRRARS